jgi:hypothetical protein
MDVRDSVICKLVGGLKVCRPAVRVSCGTRTQSKRIMDPAQGDR